MRCCCVAVISSMVVNLATAAETSYYYQHSQISSINQGQSNNSFLLVDQDRLAAISALDHEAMLKYFLSDGKSQDIQFSGPLLLNSAAFYDKNLDQIADYQAYGMSSAVQQPSSMITFGYNGEYQDLVTQLVYLRARDYDAAKQRFMTMDRYPLLNRYAGFSTDPINHIDPSGHSVKQWLKHNENWLVPTAIGLLAIVGGGIAGIRYHQSPVRRLEVAESNLRVAFESDVYMRDSFFTKVLTHDGSDEFHFSINDDLDQVVDVSPEQNQMIENYRQALASAFQSQIPVSLRAELQGACRAYNSLEQGEKMAENLGDYGWRYQNQSGPAVDNYYRSLTSAREILSDNSLTDIQQTILAPLVGGDCGVFEQNLGSLIGRDQPMNPDAFYRQHLSAFGSIFTD